MKTVIKAETKLKILRTGVRTSKFSKNVNGSIAVVDFKFYQKLILVLISLSTILIFPESPKQLESVCKSYHYEQMCNIW